jgi:uncharacterized protein (TIGR00106 family)
MNVIVDVSVVPIGVGTSLSKYIAACHQIFHQAGLETQLHANGTNIEGDWETVFAALKRCHQELHDMGVPRIATTIRLGTRVDRPQTMDDKIRSVEEKLADTK